MPYLHKNRKGECGSIVLHMWNGKENLSSTVSVWLDLEKTQLGASEVLQLKDLGSRLICHHRDGGAALLWCGMLYLDLHMAASHMGTCVLPGCPTHGPALHLWAEKAERVAWVLGPVQTWETQKKLLTLGWLWPLWPLRGVNQQWEDLV